MARNSSNKSKFANIKDPLDVYRKRYENNPSNLSYGIDYADRLSQVDQYGNAIPVLQRLIEQDPSSKLAYRKLAEASKATDDLEKAATIAVAGATGNSGQRCTAIKRILVQDSVADALIPFITEKARAIRFGDPMDPQTAGALPRGPAGVAAQLAGDYAVAILPPGSVQTGLLD